MQQTHTHTQPLRGRNDVTANLRLYKKHTYSSGIPSHELTYFTVGLISFQNTLVQVETAGLLQFTLIVVKYRVLPIIPSTTNKVPRLMKATLVQYTTTSWGKFLCNISAFFFQIACCNKHLKNNRYLQGKIFRESRRIFAFFYYKSRQNPIDEWTSVFILSKSLT